MLIKVTSASFSLASRIHAKTRNQIQKEPLQMHQIYFSYIVFRFKSRKKSKVRKSEEKEKIYNNIIY